MRRGMLLVILLGFAVVVNPNPAFPQNIFSHFFYDLQNKLEGQAAQDVTKGLMGPGIYESREGQISKEQDMRIYSECLGVREQQIRQGLSPINCELDHSTIPQSPVKKAMDSVMERDETAPQKREYAPESSRADTPACVRSGRCTPLQ